MIIEVNGNKYRVRDRASYSAKQALDEIGRRYYWKYAPSGYYNPDGTRPTDEEGNFTYILDDGERARMSERASNDPDYLDEVMDFHCIPIMGAPLLSHLLEKYEPTLQEQSDILEAQRFFYESGRENKTKSEESSSFTSAESPQETEATTPEST